MTGDWWWLLFPFGRGERGLATKEAQDEGQLAHRLGPKFGRDDWGLSASKKAGMIYYYEDEEEERCCRASEVSFYSPQKVVLFPFPLLLHVFGSYYPACLPAFLPVAPSLSCACPPPTVPSISASSSRTGTVHTCLTYLRHSSSLPSLLSSSSSPSALLPRRRPSSPALLPRPPFSPTYSPRICLRR